MNVYSLIVYLQQLNKYSCFSTQNRKVRKLHLVKDVRGLGLRIVGGKGSKYGDIGIYIRDIEQDGAADK